jgi:large subunit ribosomal protein L3
MSRGLLGKKLGMTGFFTSEGRYVPVTVIEAGPCVVTQIKTRATDGYDALQLGFGQKKKFRVSKPLQGHFKKSGDQCFQYLKEFFVKNPEEYNLGQGLSKVKKCRVITVMIVKRFAIWRSLISVQKTM